ncbi:MAG TPA: Maf family protein [Oligoflexus sp.]|uniref:Maf family protein n=1 Tax=Oligoflexus sp. TaxID=1971216 RepID=UPI002D527775|nr:Maf family protein [Oligoflexus sp.]HYX39397.1 Maf family protein [Oligoflexus sp.]
MSKKTQAIFENFPWHLVLASSSPRRQELLRYLGLPFTIAVPAIEEKRRLHESPLDYVQRNSREKAQIVYQTLAHDKPWAVIGSDTIGVLDDEVLEKPLDAADAKRMLERMSGRSHKVLTGLAVVFGQGPWASAHGPGPSAGVEQRVIETDVFFKKLTAQEISYYVGTGEPLDKAGSYGIQGIGGFLVEKISGSYSNVVGLPLVELTEILRCLPSPF